jgi:penicillin amidase
VKWLKGIVLIVIVLVLVAIVSIPRLNRFQREGELTLKGLSAPVRVLRDEKGMAYIYADNLIDALRAQGFVTAQDRLFQMELTRLFAEGRICELAGEKARELDIRMRTLGFYRNAKKHVKILDRETRDYMQAYLDGVNEYIKTRKKYHHLEFKLAGIKPEPWMIGDSLAILYYMGWSSAANLRTEIIAQMLVEKLGAKKASEIFPININPDDSEGVAHSELRMRRSVITELPLNVASDKKLMALLEACDAPLRLGSNNWTVSPTLSESGKSIVANDPHLDSRVLPGPWYPMGIITPEFRAVNAYIPGSPGSVIGRNEHIAIGVTNSYTDAQDLYVETVDPENPDNYLEGKKSIPFLKIKEILRIKDKKAPGGFREEEIIIRLTRRGPVVSDVLKDLKTEKVITMRWSPFETMNPSLGLVDIMKAKTIHDVRKSLSRVTFIMLNFVFADDQGNIGWQTSGRIPIRSQGDSTVPYVVRDSRDNWVGYIPFDKMPQSYNPPKGWLGTCNHKTIGRGFPYYVSSHFSPYYRYARLKQLMASREKTNVDDHWRFQRDLKNLMAERIAPVMAKALLSLKETEILGTILSRWDFTDDKDKVAPAVFQTVYRSFAYLTFQDELGDDVAKTMLDDWYFWENRLEVMVLSGSSEWFDDSTTADKETMNDMFQRAALEVLKELSSSYGSDPKDWRWGEIHQLEFVSPVMRSGLLKGLFGGGSHPMSGSAETLYRAYYKFNEPYSAAVTASLRMVVDLADNEKVLAVLPGGVCDRLFDDHNTDQIEAFMNGDRRYWWFSDDMIRAHAKYSCTLNPSP